MTSLSDKQLSLLLSEVAAGHMGHLDERYYEVSRDEAEPCGACWHDVLSHEHPIDASGRPGCLEDGVNGCGHRVCTIADFMRYIARV